MVEKSLGKMPEKKTIRHNSHMKIFKVLLEDFW